MRLRFALSLMIACALMFQTLDSSAEETPATPHAAGPVAVNSGPGGMGFPTGKLAAVLNYRYADKDNWYHHTSDCDGADRENRSHTWVAKFRYGIADGWDVRTATPYVAAELLADGDHSAYIGGVGDTLVQIRNQFASQKKGDLFNMAWDLGVLLPTGEVGEKKIGGAAWGGVVGIGATYLNGRHRIEGDMNYLVTAEGTHDTTKGARFRLNGHYAYAVSELLDLGIESNYEWTQEGRCDGNSLDNDMKTLYFGPKFNLKFKDYGVTFGGALLGAAYRDCQRESLTEDWRAEFKLIKVF